MQKTIVPFNNLSKQWEIIEKSFLPDFFDFASKSNFCLGPLVEKFEKEFSNYIGVNHAIGVNSGTSALHLALIVSGIGPGDKVLVPAHTFIATIWAVLYVGAIPILCDVELKTGNIDIKDAEVRLEKNTKGIIPVHIYGQPANMNKVTEFAKINNLIIIEDACQAHGAYYANKRIGNLGNLTCFSFYPGKNLGSMGEAGIIVTSEANLAKRLQSLRQHAQEERYIHNEIGFNYRMEAFQALVLSHKLKYLDEWNHKRKEIAKIYIDELNDLPVDLPLIEHHDHVYHLFVIRTIYRNELQEWLNKDKISTGLHYPVPIHHQKCLKPYILGGKEYPISEYYANHGLSLPLYPHMTDSQVYAVINSIRSFFKKKNV